MFVRFAAAAVAVVVCCFVNQILLQLRNFGLVCVCVEMAGNEMPIYPFATWNWKMCQVIDETLKRLAWRTHTTTTKRKKKKKMNWTTWGFVCDCHFLISFSMEFNIELRNDTFACKIQSKFHTCTHARTHKQIKYIKRYVNQQ